MVVDMGGCRCFLLKSRTCLGKVWHDCMTQTCEKCRDGWILGSNDVRGDYYLQLVEMVR
jgi:hypothetical protein